MSNRLDKLAAARAAFMAGRQAAADRARAMHGTNWHRHVRQITCDLPAAWCRSYRVGLFTIKSPRVTRIAPAEYWPAGRIAAGPDYPIDTVLIAAPLAALDTAEG